MSKAKHAPSGESYTRMDVARPADGQEIIYRDVGRRSFNRGTYRAAEHRVQNHYSPATRTDARTIIEWKPYAKKLPDGWKKEWDNIPFSLECWDCDGVASGDGITSPEKAVAAGWTEVEPTTEENNAFSNFIGLCPEHTASRKADAQS
jgi:hypothetical protein